MSSGCSIPFSINKSHRTLSLGYIKLFLIHVPNPKWYRYKSIILVFLNFNKSFSENRLSSVGNIFSISLYKFKLITSK